MFVSHVGKDILGEIIEPNSTEYRCKYTIFIYMHVSAQGSIIFYAPEKNLVILLIVVGLVKGLYSTQ